MESAVYTWYAPPMDIPMREVRRYLGYAGHTPSEEDAERIARSVERVKPVVEGRACYGFYDVAVTGETVTLPYGAARTRSLSRWMEGCTRAVLFAATIGAGFDRLLRRTLLTSMAEAALLQACGAAAVEAVCDRFNDELNAKARDDGFEPVRRYSPGYGDFALENQRGFFAVLNPPKHIGLTLMDTLIMSPEKSVTAIIPLKKR